MRHEILRVETYKKMPWKNGLGFTREIRREPAEGEFHWRLSIAMINEDGPFSIFPHYTRIINTLSGRGMILKVDGISSRPLLPYDPFVFNGASEVECALIDGPIDDFNLIFDPDFCRAQMEWRVASRRVPIKSRADLILLYTVNELIIDGQSRLVLPAGATMEIQNEPADQVINFEVISGKGDGHFCLIEISAPPVPALD